MTKLRSVATGPWSWRFLATSDVESPRFRWYVNGRFWGETVDGELVLSGRVGEALVVEVFDQEEDVAGRLRGVASGLRVEWSGAGLGIAMVGWEVEVFVDGDWIRREVLEASPGVVWYGVELGDLADETEHLVRVVGVDGAGVKHVVLERAGYLVRWPDLPAVDIDVVDGDLVVGVVDHG